MNKGNNASKGKGKVVKGTQAKKSSSTRATQPQNIQIREGETPQPMETDSMAHPPSNRRVYPFGKKPRFKEEEDRGMYQKFGTFEVIPPILPNINDLNSLGLMDALVEMFEASNLMWMFETDPGSYAELMKEFFASFVVEWEDGSVERINEEAKVAILWEFQLGGTVFEMTREDVHGLLGISVAGELPNPSEDAVNSFWTSIAHGDYSGVTKNRTVTMLVDLMDKVVHRLIARNLYPRMDKGRFVNKKDLKVMMFIKEKKRLDVFGLLSNHFLDYHKPEHRGKAFGGGNIITLIAKHFGFELDASHAKGGEWLTQEYMENARMVERASKVPMMKKSKTSNAGGTYSYVPSQSNKRSEPDPEQSPYALEDMQASLDTLTRSHETLAKSHEDLATFARKKASWSHEVVSWSHDVVAWQSKMFGNLYSHIGWPGYEPYPPPPSSFGFQFPTPPSTKFPSDNVAGPSSSTRGYVDEDE